MNYSALNSSKVVSFWGLRPPDSRASSDCGLCLQTPSAYGSQEILPDLLSAKISGYVPVLMPATLIFELNRSVLAS